MPRPVTTQSLDPILRGVSRSVFLSFRVAPASIRRQLGLGYLFCRAADTIADTRLLCRDNRLESLRRYRAQFEVSSPRTEDIERLSREVGAAQAIPQERELLVRLRECFDELDRLEEADRRLMRRLVATLTLGMEMDLERFPPEESGRVAALETEEDLDLYTYYVAGCVGEFWTELQVSHIRALERWDLAAMRPRGIEFGKGLQLTNILRDVDRDLSLGRSYFPRPRLETAGLRLEDLRAGLCRQGLVPILLHYLAATLKKYRTGWEYTLAIPRRVPRLRLACALPLFIGLETLALLASSPDPYAPGTLHKIPRSSVRRLAVRAMLSVFSDVALNRMYSMREARVLAALRRHGAAHPDAV